MNEANEKLFYYVVRSNADRTYYSSIGTAKDEQSAFQEVERLRNQKNEYGFNYNYFVAAVPVEYDGSFNGWKPVEQAILDKYAELPQIAKDFMLQVKE